MVQLRHRVRLYAACRPWSPRALLPSNPAKLPIGYLLSLEGADLFLSGPAGEVASDGLTANRPGATLRAGRHGAIGLMSRALTPRARELSQRDGVAGNPLDLIYHLATNLLER